MLKPPTRDSNNSKELIKTNLLDSYGIEVNFINTN
jgi:hypothetical protein